MTPSNTMLRSAFHAGPKKEPQDLVWMCPCGCTQMWLRQSGRITCAKCERYHGQEWDWTEETKNKQDVPELKS